MQIEKKLLKLRELMNDKGLDAYIIPSSDNHQSEYVGEYFKSREFISGFTGSAGTVIITKDKAGLWTDGRYFIQAERELKGSTIKLYKIGQEGYPNTEEFLYDEIKKNGTIGFDGRLISTKQGLELEEKLGEKGIKIEYKYDLIDLIWGNRPSLPKNKAFLLDVKYCGESFGSKLSRLREKMKEENVSSHIIASLDDIAWLFNIRGGDVKHNLVLLSYALVTLDDVYLFVDKSKLNDHILNELKDENVCVRDYDDIYEYVKKLNDNERVLMDFNKTNYYIYNNLSKGVVKVNKSNPTILFKAVKNKVEIDNIKNSHIKDGVAITKFMYWLKNNVGKIKITEMSASKKLEDFRRQQDKFIEPSFDTIAGYKEHAAMMHYCATEETDVELKPEYMFLFDSGGQYYDGTTDTTRTLVLGPISDELKLHFTTVVRAMIGLSKAKFLYGCRGFNLDILCRGIIWQMGIDYQCGTGHGIGFVLNVHEAPNGFRWKEAPGKFESAVLEAGMLTSNEPGIYIEGSHGIRIENELLTNNVEKNIYGQFMNFEPVTMVPIDLDGIDPNVMTNEEREYLNCYHKLVFEKISPYLDEEEVKWLRKYTRSV